MSLTYSCSSVSGSVIVWSETEVYADLTDADGSFDERVRRARLLCAPLLETLSDLIAVVETYDDAWEPGTDLYTTRVLASEAEMEAARAHPAPERPASEEREAGYGGFGPYGGNNA